MQWNEAFAVADELQHGRCLLVADAVDVGVQQQPVEVLEAACQIVHAVGVLQRDAAWFQGGGQLLKSCLRTVMTVVTQKQDLQLVSTCRRKR